CGFGMLLPLLPENISKMVTMGLMAAPVITLTIAVMSFVILKVRKARFKSKAASQFS
ncbi:DedA family protein, partial [Vibrio parahaemolyticus]|nr:DedA family protein [Vibrio parahaemolyticus]